MNFIIMPRSASILPLHKGKVILFIDNWNDYLYYTMFRMKYCDDKSAVHDLGNVKIGYIEQREGEKTLDRIVSQYGFSFDSLSGEYFSLGEDVNFYKNIRKLFDDETGNMILHAINDLVSLPKIPSDILKQDVFSVSLLRDASITTIQGQFKRALQRIATLTNYKFSYKRESSNYISKVSIDFDVIADSHPSTNVHAIIGRNGIGKTTILNDMIHCVLSRSPEDEKNIENSSGFYEKTFNRHELIDNHFFSGVISVSFSAFDPFNPPVERNDPAKGPSYYYIGLKDPLGGRNKELDSLHKEFKESFSQCIKLKSKADLWRKFISYIDPLSMTHLANLINEITYDGKDFNYSEDFEKTLTNLSSGHAIVLFTITKLVDKCEEKTLVIIDEPESHLHPPLLSSFIRALSELLDIRNGVAIIATHSPVVVQEIPCSCVTKITRVNSAMSTSRPEIQTYGENVGVLTREIFGLEISNTGFHKVLSDEVESGLDYQSIINKYGDNLGFEAQAILRVLLASRKD